MNFSSRYLEKAVEEIAGLPGIGKKTALRLALYLLRQDKKQVHHLANALTELTDKIIYCKSCGNLSDTEICGICANPSRNQKLICIVEDLRDVMAIENTGQYNGIYHVLGGVINPMEGIGPNDLNFKTLLEKAEMQKIDEIIFALGTTMEGETTTFYLYRKLSEKNISLTSIARGISMGDQLEYADEVTLARSIINRIPYEAAIKQNQKS